VLIDTGLQNNISKLKRVLDSLTLGWKDIKAILITHGHLDHVRNLFQLKELTGAPVLAHAAEQSHLNGTYPYKGVARLCGLLEGIGRRCLHYQRVAIDEPLLPNAVLPYWGGLQVIFLPGHTAGHCGFYSGRFNLLFSGDLFASSWFATHLPPAFLNSTPERLGDSLQRAKSLNPQGIVPSHYDKLDVAMHRRRLESLLAPR
jgi:glyoxylase-like metal-dependent hydrolase (beta-lactamase superfamily II)